MACWRYARVGLAECSYVFTVSLTLYFTLVLKFFQIREKFRKKAVVFQVSRILENNNAKLDNCTEKWLY